MAKSPPSLTITAALTSIISLLPYAVDTITTLTPRGLSFFHSLYLCWVLSVTIDESISRHASWWYPHPTFIRASGR
ncbi:hypothetical protein BDN71DRAFT_1306360 [Pleurotus eryngii]|uniref:Uncharacterized protein n=1 Tax=Pleurotus eryngii TaxID=5323 RepID=A0A9P5ZSH9_PLEER|nr:hypothetical protein BDN71DRAFT_1306360 [Pleurotus eryngii]